MASVEGVGMGTVAAPRVRGGSRVPTGFAVPDDDAQRDAGVSDAGRADAGSDAGAVGGPVGMGGLLGLQEFGGDRGGDSPARHQADTLLTELAALQRTLLGGGDPGAVLERLDGMLGSVPTAGSPVLLALLGAVRMRARVELARRGWQASAGASTGGSTGGRTDNPFIAAG